MEYTLRAVKKISNGPSFRERVSEVNVSNLPYRIHPIGRGEISTNIPITAHTVVIFHDEQPGTFNALFLQTQMERLFNDTDFSPRPLGVNGRFILAHTHLIDWTPFTPALVACERPRLVAYNPDIPPRRLQQD